MSIGLEHFPIRQPRHPKEFYLNCAQTIKALIFFSHLIMTPRTSSSSGQNEVVREELARAIQEEEAGEIELTDSEAEDEFIRKYGDVNFQYIKRPKDAVWFIKPHALNYFKDGVLYRTKGERSSSKTELFLDLMYVGIIANLAGDAVEHAGWGALLRYILLFMAVWTIWCDIKDFTNYYYNEDLSQKLYILWILILLTIFCNNQYDVLKDRSGAEFVIIPYILCRVSLAISLFVYTLWIPEHRVQQRIYSACLLIESCLWIIVIFLNTRGKIGLAIALFVIEQITFALCFHPWLKRKLKLTTSTALNIEHEVERFGTFVTIAIGEFLYKILAQHDLGSKFQDHLWRGIFLLIIAYIMFWLYNYGSTAKKATHALRHSGFRAVSWIYLHLPLIAGIVLAADAGGDLCKIGEHEFGHSAEKRLEHGYEGGSTSESGTSESSSAESGSESGESGEEEEPIQAIKFFFTGGLFVALVALHLIGLLDDPKDPKGLHLVNRFWRIVFRIPIGVIVLVLPFADITITAMMGIITILLAVLLVYESVMLTPRKCLPFNP